MLFRSENHKYSIEEAFRECFYIVPDYQREYVWTDKEVHQLLEDVGEQIDAGSTKEYFIGTVLVSPADAEALAEALYRLIADPDRRAAMAAAGPKAVAAGFTWDDYGARAVALYRRLRPQ